MPDKIVTIKLPSGCSYKLALVGYEIIGTLSRDDEDVDENET